MEENQEKALSPSSRVPLKTTEQFSGTEVAQRAEQAAVYVAAQAKAEIESAFIMAARNPRNRDQARHEILQACKNPIFAKLALYRKPVGGTTIVGPSIRFAEEMIRAWRNVKIQSMVIYEDDDRRLTSVNIVDLESNISYSPKITIEKTVERKYAKDREIVGERLNSKGERVFIVKATDDEIRNKENALLSKEIRNSSLRLIPQDIIEDAKDQIHITSQTNIAEDPDKAKKQILDSFAGIGVSPKKLEEYLQRDMASVSPAEIAELRTIFAAIKSGEAKWTDYMAKAETLGKKATETADIDATLEAGDPSTHQDVKDGVKKK